MALRAKAQFDFTAQGKAVACLIVLYCVCLLAVCVFGNWRFDDESVGVAVWVTWVYGGIVDSDANQISFREGDIITIAVKVCVLCSRAWISLRALLIDSEFVF